MQKVLVVSNTRQSLMPCSPARARMLLRGKRAAVLRRFPFTIILKDRSEGAVQPMELKVDPGSKVSGIALVADFAKRGKAVVFAAEVQHRGQAIKDALLSRRAIRRGRRNRKTRYRIPRFDNRTRPSGWLPPSLMSRVFNVTTWAMRLQKFAPLSGIAVETVRFDTQLIVNPDISGVEYQQGTLAGYELREYLLQKWHRTCAYCKKTDSPLQVEHIVPRSRGGSDRASNLTLACEPCNKKKNDRTAAEFGFPNIQKQANLPLKDAAAVNATRYMIGDMLKILGLPVTFWAGGRTKFNRTKQSYPKAHWIDAACVGISGSAVTLSPDMQVLQVKACGHGSRQMCGSNQFGFPIRHRTRQKCHFGFQTGDMVKAVVPSGKRKGSHDGRVLCRASGSFDVSINAGRVQGISHKYCKSIHQNDGCNYFKKGGRNGERIPPTTEVVSFLR